MKIETTQDVENTLRMYLASAAVGAALELGLFWLLIENPLPVKEISLKYNIPYDRCQSWLALLAELGFLECENESYFPSSIAKSAILEAYSPETWAFLAQEIREGYPAINNLLVNISHPNSVWEAQGMKRPNYITLMKSDVKRAERFTRMLYELHSPLAEKLAKTLDMTNVKQLMDLGGGSGVVSLALLNHHPNLNAVVVDIENVCTVGRKIAKESLIADRITYHDADFVQDDLPEEFDMILECDVGVYTEELFLKVWNSLNEGGRFVIVTNTNEQGAWLIHTESNPTISWYLHFFFSSLDVPRFIFTSIDDIKIRLTNTGFQDVIEQVQEDGSVLIQAFKKY
ncbi:MAG: methyltransferase [Candidatus Hodarchaeales archaeon]|jgi:predicted O-methyltransferase YrrM